MKITQGIIDWFAKRSAQYEASRLKNMKIENERIKTLITQQKKNSWQSILSMSDVSPQERVALGLPGFSDTVTDADELLAKYGSDIFKQVYLSNGYVKNPIDILVGFIFGSAVDVTSEQEDLIDKTNEALGEDFLSVIQEAYTWALVQGTGFCVFDWELRNGAMLPCNLRMVSKAQEFQLDAETGKVIGCRWDSSSTVKGFIEGDQIVDLVPIEYILVLRGERIPDTPYGGSIIRTIWDDYYNKKAATRSINVFVDKQAIPHLGIMHKDSKEAIYEPPNPVAMNALKDALENMGNNYGITFPPGLDFKEIPSGSGSGNIMSFLLDYYDKAISRGILGTAMLNLESKYGTFAQALSQAPVMHAIIQRKAKELAQDISQQIYMRVFEANSITSRVKIDFNLPDVTIDSKVERYQKMATSKYRPSRKEYSDTLGIPIDDIEDMPESSSGALSLEHMSKEPERTQGKSRTWMLSQAREIERESLNDYGPKLKKLWRSVGKAVAEKKSTKTLIDATAKTYTDWLGNVYIAVSKALEKRFNVVSKGLPKVLEFTNFDVRRALGQDWYNNTQIKAKKFAERCKASIERYDSNLPTEMASWERVSKIVEQSAINVDTALQTEFTRFYQESQEAWRKQNLTIEDCPGFEFVGVEDKRQTEICASFSGNYYKFDGSEGDKSPPLHPNCRSVWSLLDAVDAKNIVWSN